MNPLHNFFIVVAFVPVISPSKQCWSYLSSSTIISFHSTENILTGTQNKNSFSGSWLWFLWQPKQFWLWCHSSIVLSFRATKPFSPGHEPRIFFFGGGGGICPLLLQSPCWNRHHWSWHCSFTMLKILSCRNHLHCDLNLVDFWGCGLCSSNLLTKTNNFGLGTILLLCLRVKATDTIFTGTGTQDSFLGLWPLLL
jgi:hypothetical protein